MCVLSQLSLLLYLLSNAVDIIGAFVVDGDDLDVGVPVVGSIIARIVVFVRIVGVWVLVSFSRFCFWFRVCFGLICGFCWVRVLVFGLLGRSLSNNSTHEYRPRVPRPPHT